MNTIHLQTLCVVIQRKEYEILNTKWNIWTENGNTLLFILRYLWTKKCRDKKNKVAQC